MNENRKTDKTVISLTSLYVVAYFKPYYYKTVKD